MNLLMVWPQTALALGALAVLGFGASRRLTVDLTRYVAMAAVAIAMLALATVPMDSGSGLLRTDLLGTSLQFVFLLAALPLLYLMEPSDEVPPALVLGSLIGMGLIAVAGSLLLLFIGLELMSVPAYLLVWRSRSPRALEAAVKYFFAGGTASALFVMGMALHFAAAGDLLLGTAPGPLGSAGLALMAAAALFKLGAVPLHFWLPDVYQASDTELTAFFATGLKAAAVLFLLRLCALSASPSFAQALSWVAALTVVFGALVALRQRDVQRLLAYSSINHAGFMLLAVAAWTAQGGTLRAGLAVFFYLASYLFMGGGAFLWLRSAAVTERPQLRGMAKAKPRDAAAFATLLLAQAGIPPTIGFPAKLLVFWEAFKAGLYGPMLVAALGALLSLGYYLGMIRDMYFDEEGEERPGEPRPGRGLVLLAAAVSAVLGLAPFLVELAWRRG